MNYCKQDWLLPEFAQTYWAKKLWDKNLSDQDEFSLTLFEELLSDKVSY